MMTEPQELRPGMPQKPAWLDPDASAEWAAIATDCWQMGLLTDATVPTLAAYCAAYAQFQKVSVILHKEGLTVKFASGYQRAHPLVKLQDRAMRDILQLGSRLGLNPLARARLGIKYDRERRRFTRWADI